MNFDDIPDQTQQKLPSFDEMPAGGSKSPAPSLGQATSEAVTGYLPKLKDIASEAISGLNPFSEERTKAFRQQIEHPSATFGLANNPIGSAAELMASPFTAGVKSAAPVIAAGMASAAPAVEKGIGALAGRELPSTPYEEYYRRMEPGAETALGLAIPKGAPLKLPAIPEAPPPFEMHPQAPVGTVRADSGARLLPPEVPHTLPPNTPTTMPTRPGVGAQGASSPLTGISQPTLEHVRNVLEEDGFTPYSLDQRLDEMSAHQFLGELSPNTEARMGGIASFPGESKNTIVNAIAERKAETPLRIKTALDDAFGPAEDLSQSRRLLNIEQQQKASPLYKAFEQTSISPTPEMLDTSPAGLMPRLRAAGAFGQAKRFAGIEGVPWTRAFDVGLDEGPELLRQYPTAQSWDLVKQALDHKISHSFNDFGEPTGLTRRLTQLKNDLVSSIDNHPNGDIGALWKQARDTFAGPAQIKAAEQMGKRILTEHIDANELPFLTASYSTKQMQGLRNGIRAQLENQFGRAGPQDRRVVNQLLSENNQRKIRWVMNDDTKANQLFSAINGESEMLDAPTRIYKGSPTAARTQAAKDYGPKASIFSPENIGKMAGTAVEAGIHPLRTIGRLALGQAEKHAVNAREAAALKFRSELARLNTLQGPERNATLKWIMENVPVGRKTGGRVVSRPQQRQGGGRVSKPKNFANGGALHSALQTAKRHRI
jgi:hypothetical protein